MVGKDVPRSSVASPVDDAPDLSSLSRSIQDNGGKAFQENAAGAARSPEELSISL